jgi:hypothetical protein
MDSANRADPWDPAMATKSLGSTGQRSRSRRRILAALFSELRGSQPIQIVMTMAISYLISLGALTWNYHHEAPSLVPTAIDAPVPEAARPALSPTRTRGPLPLMTASRVETAPAPAPPQIVRPTAMVAAAPESESPVEVSADSPGSIPVTQTELDFAARVCASESAANSEMCRRYRGGN